MAFDRVKNFLKNIESDLFKYNQYPCSDLKSYHLKYWLTFIVNLYLKVYLEVVNSKNIPPKYQIFYMVIYTNTRKYLQQKMYIIKIFI